jgi:hypothetical protein
MTLRDLEMFHRVLGLYLWLSFRNLVMYADYETVCKLKKRVGVVFAGCTAEEAPPASADRRGGKFEVGVEAMEDQGS